MRHKLKDLFNKSALRTKKAALTFAAAFTAAFMPLSAGADADLEVSIPANAAAVPLAPKGVAGYWKLPDYDIVVKLEKCETGICASIHSFNPHHPRIKDAAAMLFNITETVAVDEFAFSGYRRWAPEKVTEADIKSLCGYSGKTDLKQNFDGSWEGTFHHPYQWRDYGLTLRLADENNLVAKGFVPSFSLFKVPMEATRADPPPPDCKNPYSIS